MSPTHSSRLNSEVTCVQLILGQFRSKLVPLTGQREEASKSVFLPLFLTAKVGGKKPKATN